MIELTRRVNTLADRLNRLIAALMLPPRSNHAAALPPGVGDDEDDGYHAGSLWTNLTTDTAYICVDATVGAAVWKQIT